jgi:hypothetical protein
MEDKEWIYDSVNNLWMVESIKRSIENDSKNKQLTEDRKLFHFDLFINSL